MDNNITLSERYTQWSERTKNFGKKTYLVCWIEDKKVLADNVEAVRGLFEYDFHRLVCYQNARLMSAANFQEALHRADKEPFGEYIVLVKDGTDFGDLLDVLDKTDMTGIGLMGHILDRNSKGSFYEIHDQTILIHREMIPRLLHLPYYAENRHYNLLDIERSQENFHDDYTPLWIQKKETQITVNSPAPGALWIDETLKTHLVVPFSAPLRKAKRYLYPQEKVFDKEHLKISCSDKLSPYFSVSLEPILTDGSDRFKGPLRHLVVVCSALKPFNLIQKLGYDECTTVAFIDHSRVAISIVRYIWEQWDGRDYPRLMRELRELTHGFSDQDVEKYWNFFLSSFGGEQGWLLFFSDIRKKIKATFKEVDLLQPGCLESYLESPGDGSGDYLWLSNVYNFKPTSMLKQRAQIRETSRQLFSALRERKPESVIQAFFPQASLHPTLKAKEIIMCKDLDFESRDSYSETFQFLQKNLYLEKNLQPTENLNSWEKIQDLKLPELKISMQFPHEQVMKELDAVKSHFVRHRLDAEGWESVCLHGLAPEKTEAAHKYGFQDEDEAPYEWTTISSLVPTVRDWCQKNLLDQGLLSRFYRVRIMRLKAGGYISPHIDNHSENRYFRAINIAINNPRDCIMVFENYGVVPWRSGDVRLLDISYKHSVSNGSSEDRYHLIVHGKFNFSKSTLEHLL